MSSANRPRGYGFTAEIQRKQQGKWNVSDAIAVVEWIKEVLNCGGKGTIADTITALDESATTAQVQAQFKSGSILCHLINILKPGSVKKIAESTMAFKQMENIGNFLAACGKLEMQSTDLFQTVDLYEGSNIPQVITTLMALGRKSKKIEGYTGPTIGPAESTKNVRTFTDEQLRAGDGIINLQAGSNKGASQAGQNFGKTRAIID